MKKAKHCNRLIICLALLIAGNTGFYAQQLNLAFLKLDRENGLSQGTCPFISRDSKGFVWIATVDGLNRFDGKTVKVYRPDASQPHQLVGNILTSACYEAKTTGNLWFTTYNAVHRYVRDYDHFDTFQLKDLSGKQLTEDYYAFHLDESGLLWLRVGEGEASYLHLFNIHTGRDSIVCPMGGYRAVTIADKAGVIQQVLCSEFGKKGLEVIDLTNGFTNRPFLRDGSISRFVHETFVENDTLVWLGLSNGIAAFNPKTGTTIIYDQHDGKLIGDCWSVCPYRQPFMFVASNPNGLWVFDRKSRRFIQQFKYEPDNPFCLMDNDVRNLYIDSEENLWVAHWKYGFSYVNLRKNKFSSPPKARKHSFSQILTGPDANIWCHSPELGFLVYRQDGQLIDTIDNFFPEFDYRISFKYPLFFPKGTNIGLNTNKLLEWEPEKRKLRIIEQLPIRIVDGCTNLAGETLVASVSGIFRINLNPQGTYTLNPVSLLNYFKDLSISNIFYDSQGYLYVSDNSERLLVFSEAPTGLMLQKTIDGAGAAKGFFEMPNEQGLWVATTAGLLRIEANLESRMLNQTSDGLPNATYYGVALDQSGHLWLSSNRGLICYDTALQVLSSYLPVDGLFGNEFNSGAFYQAQNGEIWAGGFGGLAAFHPDSIQNVPYEPQVQFIKILINDLPLESEKQVEVLERLNLDYDKNTISFEFVALEFSNPAANQFRFRLLGYDNTWVNNGTHGFARYGKLPPGNYTFEVLAANSDGVWSKTPKQFKIHVKTPYYQTWWFYLLCTMSIAALVYAWFWYRLQQAIKIERMRVQISSDLHDDVGTLLAGLAMQSEALEMSAPEKDKGKLRRISELSRNAMGHMRDTVWAIDSRKDKFEDLIDRMREHAEETLTPKDVRFEIAVENLSPKQSIGSLVRQTIYLIYKEAVTNVAKHSDADTVSISLKKSGAQVEMSICDNGKSPEKPYKTTGSGTSNMQMRAEKIGGTLSISRETGFCVSLRFPV